MTEAKPYKAPGRPGEPPAGIAAQKQGIGTSAAAESRVWFTVSGGTIADISFPSPDRACVRTLKLIVTNEAGFFSDETIDATSTVMSSADGVPEQVVTSVCKKGLYRLEKSIICHPRMDAVLMRVRFFPLEGGQSLRVFAYLVAYPFEAGASAQVVDCKGQRVLAASTEGAAMALAASIPFAHAAVGYVGASDGLEQLRDHGFLKREYTRAEHGFVALAGELDWHAHGQEWTLAVGFGGDTGEAAQHTRGALDSQFSDARESYTSGWRQWHAGLAALGSDRDSALVATSATVLKTVRDKRFPGGAVAALATPWGPANGENAQETYHLVWCRDLVQSATALLAIGRHEEVRDTLSFLRATQEPAGHWPQNMTLAGKPRWPAVQLDEVALPILLVGLAEREGAIDQRGVAAAWPMVRRAASYLVRSGPSTLSDRWENEHGFTPFTLGAEIAALLVAARYADRFEPSIALYLRETADAWNDSIERWLWKVDSDTTERFGVRGYYARAWDIPERERSGYRPKVGEPSSAVSVDVLALVRFGVRAADDPRVVETLRLVDALLRVDFGETCAWRRYCGDDYGEGDDGQPYKPGRGVGRPWPLLTGERAHYELHAGRVAEAARLARAMELLATPEHLLSEQVWDGRDLPERDLVRGGPTNSAAPLAWAHAEYLVLCRSLKDGRAFDLPRETVERYLEGKVRSAFAGWRLSDPRETMTRGATLRVELEAPSSVTASCAGARVEVATRDCGLGVHVVDFPHTAALAPGSAIELSFTSQTAIENEVKHRTHGSKVSVVTISR